MASPSGPVKPTSAFVLNANEVFDLIVCAQRHQVPRDPAWPWAGIEQVHGVAEVRAVFWISSRPVMYDVDGFFNLVVLHMTLHKDRHAVYPPRSSPKLDYEECLQLKTDVKATLEHLREYRGWNCKRQKMKVDKSNQSWDLLATVRPTSWQQPNRNNRFLQDATSRLDFVKTHWRLFLLQRTLTRILGPTKRSLIAYRNSEFKWISARYQ
ncbi:hypothetical protein FB451DRAFT_1163580 [Mycena latifolia]|nr:hypothetical protein FB451DRAFT_1163580 [Mycena latifolia]